MEFKIERAGKEDIAAIMNLVVEVHEQIPEDRKSWFVINPEEDTQLLEEGKCWGYTAVDTETGKLAAAFIAAFPGTSSHNLGYDSGLPEEEIPKVAHMDTAVVSPEYRGCGLQKRMMEFAEEDLRKAGYHYLCCTVHPDNVYSKNNVLKQGYKIMATKEKYNGFLRHVFLKEI